MSDNVVNMKDAKNGNSYIIPPEGDSEVGKKVFRLLAEVLKERKDSGRIKRWLRGYELVKNKHWKREPQQKVPLMTANFCFLHHQRTINTLTDNNPTFDIAKIPDATAELEEKSLMIQRAADYWWKEEEQQEDFSTSVWNGETYGVAIEKVMFNIEAGDYGIGEVQTIPIDPFQFGFFPTDLKDPKRLEDSYVIFYFYPMKVTEARRIWPNKDIKPDSEWLQDIGDERKKIATTEGKTDSFMTSFGGIVRELINTAMGGTDAGDDVLIVETWVRDRSTTKTESQGEDGSVTVEVKPKYTGEIRYICSCNGGNTVLEDRDNPNINPTIPAELARQTYLYNRRPFSMVNSVRDTNDALGESDLEQIEKLQMEIDKAISQFILFKDRASRRKIKNPRTSGVKNSDFTNTQGIINPSNANEAAAIDYMREPEMPVDIWQSIDMFKNLMLSIAGTFDLDQALQEGGNRLAYKSLQELLERTATMQRGKVRAYSRLIRMRGRMFVSLMQNFYTEDRIVSFINSDGENVAARIRGPELILPVKITVIDGSTLPVSRVQQREEAISLRQMGVYDDDEILRFLDVPGRKELLKRKKEGMLQPIMQRLQKLGMPPGLIQYLGAVATTDDNKFNQAVKSGQLPPFQQILMALLQQLQGTPDPQAQQAILVAQKTQAEVEKLVADAKRAEADTMLLVEKAATERANQLVKVYGMQYDEQLLNNQRAQILSELHRIELETRARFAEIHARKAGEGRMPYGGKSDNEE